MRNHTECPIWRTSAAVKRGSGDYDIVDSPRAGGRYRIAGSLNLEDLTDEQRVLVSNWILAQHRAGDDAPLLTSDTVAAAIQRPTPSVGDRRDSLLELLANEAKSIGAELAISGKVDEGFRDLQTKMQLHSSSKNERETRALIEFLIDENLVRLQNGKVRLTFNGWEYLETKRATNLASVQAFVAMWFSDQTTALYQDGIEPAVLSCGYRPLRIDQKGHVNKIDDEIISEIRRSRFLVADFTCEPEKPRGGVYFEAGFAMGLHIPVIWMCRRDLISQVHFDTRQYNHITWSTPAEAREALANRIGAVLGDGPEPRLSR